MSTRTYLQSRIDTAPLVAGLAIGDLVAVTAFVIIGQINHGGQPLANPEIIPGTLAPFLIGWILVGFLGGLFTLDSVSTVRRALSWTVPAWVFAALIAHALRATALFEGDTALTFLAVTLTAGGLLVVGYRCVAAYAANNL